MNPIFLIVWLIGVIVIGVVASAAAIGPLIVIYSIALAVSCVLLFCGDTHLEKRYRLFSLKRMELRLVEQSFKDENGNEDIKYRLMFRCRFPEGWYAWHNYTPSVYSSRGDGEAAYKYEVEEIKSEIGRLRIRYGKKTTTTISTYRDESHLSQFGTTVKAVNEDALRAQITEEVKRELRGAVDNDLRRV